MPSGSTARHRRILRLQAKIIGGIVGVIMALTAGSGVMQAIENNQSDDTAQVVEVRNDFWKVVAGEEAPSASTSNYRLAIDLRELMGPTDPQATRLPMALNEFKAGANRYPGIEDRLGVNPFDHGTLSCEVCGSLSSEMRGKLLLIKQGKLDTVVSQELSTVSTDRGFQLTPFEMGLPVWIGLVYVSATTAALVIAIRVDARKHEYRANMLNWKYEGGSTSDPYRRISKALSPLYTTIVLPLERKLDRTKDGDEVLNAINLRDARKKLQQALRMIDSLPAPERSSPEVTTQRHEIEKMLEAIQDEVEAYVAGYDSSIPRRSADATLASANQLLRSAENEVLARREAREIVRDIDETQRGQTATG